MLLDGVRAGQTAGDLAPRAGEASAADARALFAALAVGLSVDARHARIAKLLRCCARHVRRIEDGARRLTRDHAAVILRRVERADNLARKAERVKVERAARERDAEIAGAVEAKRMVEAWLRAGRLPASGLRQVRPRPALGRPPGVRDVRPRRAPRLLPD